ncbi:MAG: hypothetical protein KGD74_00020 [Candidatus Lokiarchaeota archaeon]|nr:hypothetical protein [Candidatus Lokiarchaeota archaeon]
MEVKEKQESNLNYSQMTLFRFELNRSQTSLFLILSLIGIFMLPFMLAGDIFLNLFQFLFSILPAYLSEPIHYHEDYLIYPFFRVLISIIISTIFLILSIYALKKILRHKNAKHKVKGKTIHQERIVNWFGLKISHGQSLFIFSASLAGIFFTVQHFLESIISPVFGFELIESFCWIPDGPTQSTSHVILLDNVPLVIKAIFFLLCLYSLYMVRRGKPINPSKKITKNYSLLVFIASFVVFILLSARIFCHLALFNYEISSLLGISYNAPNPYQNEDLIITISFLCICLALMITSFFLKEQNYREMKTSDELSWLQVKLTPHRAIILLSSALLYIIFFTNYYLTIIFLFGGFGAFYFNFYHFILIPIIFFCYYPIGKILKNHRFDNIIENIDNSREFNTNWFRFHLSKINSIILLSVSCGVVGLYIYQLLVMNMSAQAFLSDPYSPNLYMLFSFPAITVVICLILVVIVYTIKKTLPSIKSSE